jgi:acyl-CoA dehydrogenase
LYLVITGLSRAAILEHGTEEQKQRYIPPTVTGEEKFCFAITEPNAGTNSFKIQTIAKDTGKGTYKISGQKIFISGADVAEWILLVARTTPYSQVKDRREGLALFIVDAKAPGIELNPLNVAMVCPERQFIVNFDEVEVPAENLVGEKDKGVRVLFDALNPERLLVAAMSLGIGDFALQKAVEYANTRAPFDEPIGSYQALQHPMAYAKAHLEASRLMLYRAAQVYDAGSVAGAESNMAKLLCTEAATEACEIALQTHGGYGFDLDYDVVSLWSIARIMEVAPINNQMVLNFLGEKVLGLSKSYGRFRG